MDKSICPRCAKPAMSLVYVDGDWACRHCLSFSSSDTPSLIEYVQLTPEVKSSKGHIADIKARRLDTKTGKMYYDKGTTRYFY